ncbi:MAG: aminotransferase class I/II-fold pyridoxal phosphate-dependent enzyme, partial [Clostridia bacterium]|nr:aminotransferase class I/II-fold pyridoxal phosphate-dependent enzyme [Clostridia bacterium]
MTDIFAKCFGHTKADEVKEMGIYPYFHALESKQDTEVVMEGKRRIMLGSNNYLGLTTNEAVIEAGVNAYRTLGSGCSGSRFLNGTLSLHLELEKRLGAFLHKEDVISFSTGFQTNLGIISAIAGLGDYIVMDAENHASLYDGARLSFGKCTHYKHNDMEDLARLLAGIPESKGAADGFGAASADTRGEFTMQAASSWKVKIFSSSP